MLATLPLPSGVHGSEETVRDELGAHVSVAGGVDRAPARAEAIGARVFQIFTKQPGRWADPILDPDVAVRFREERTRLGAVSVGSHDAYLINLASPDPALRRRSILGFTRELDRARALDLDWVVTHPGNATDGDVDSGIARNAAGLTEALESSPGRCLVLLELTAGAGTSVGGSFEHLARIREGIAPSMRERVGFCVDTCHAWVAGYDLRDAWDEVWREAGDTVDLDLIHLFHLNDAKAPLGSRLDRHEHIGEGHLGLETFARLLNDPRFGGIPKLLETPKGDDGISGDLRNLATLRSLRCGGPENHRP